ncbi:MAG: hypothetical protein WCE80_07770, partial [Acidimicrobiia bacterium]
MPDSSDHGGGASWLWDVEVGDSWAIETEFGGPGTLTVVESDSDSVTLRIDHERGGYSTATWSDFDGDGDFERVTWSHYDDSGRLERTTQIDDTDGDGNLDDEVEALVGPTHSYVDGFDADLDGVADDSMVESRDADGWITQEIDVDSDGTIDYRYRFRDADNDGEPDPGTYERDADGDGVYEFRESDLSEPDPGSDSREVDGPPPRGAA